MFADLRLVACALLAGAFLSGVARAAGVDPAAVAPTIDAIHQAAERDAVERCTSGACRGMRTLDTTLDILLDAQATSNGLTRPSPRDRDRRTNLQLEHVLLDHPDLFGDLCHVSAGLAPRYGQENAPGDLFVAVGLIETAARTDARGHGGCLPRVISAFPQGPKADLAIANASTLCRNGAFGRAAACDAIRR